MATKIDLVERVAKKLDYLSQADARHAVDCVLESIQDALVAEERVEIRGFGSLSVRKRKYADKDEYYNSVYYRMSKHIEQKLNK